MIAVNVRETLRYVAIERVSQFRLVTSLIYSSSITPYSNIHTLLLNSCKLSFAALNLRSALHSFFLISSSSHVLFTSPALSSVLAALNQTFASSPHTTYQALARLALSVSSSSSIHLLTSSKSLFCTPCASQRSSCACRTFPLPRVEPNQHPLLRTPCRMSMSADVTSPGWRGMASLALLRHQVERMEVRRRAVGVWWDGLVAGLKEICMVRGMVVMGRWENEDVMVMWMLCFRRRGVEGELWKVG
jgi:hypothetical protein